MVAMKNLFKKYIVIKSKEYNINIMADHKNETPGGDRRQLLMFCHASRFWSFK